MEGTGKTGTYRSPSFSRLPPCVCSRDLRSEAARPDRTSAPQHIEVYDILRLTAKAIQNRDGIDCQGRTTSCAAERHPAAELRAGHAEPVTKHPHRRVSPSTSAVRSTPLTFILKAMVISLRQIRCTDRHCGERKYLYCTICTHVGQVDC